MNCVGRIIARGGKIAGLFIPMGECELDGIYNVLEWDGEYTLIRVGEPAMKREQFIGVDLQSLMNYRPNSCMTVKELDSVK